MSILKLRMARAEAAGVSYREYMLELLDTGRHLQARTWRRRSGASASAVIPALVPGIQLSAAPEQADARSQ